MVAYSFKAFFAPQIEAGTKRQTIRSDRRRHARPGEMVQLYVGMRTKACRKIRPDVRCTKVGEVSIEVGPVAIDGLHVDGVELSLEEAEAFARADGFPDRAAMHAFWMKEHGAGRFDGVIIYWDPGHV